MNLEALRRGGDFFKPPRQVISGGYHERINQNASSSPLAATLKAVALRS